MLDFLPALLVDLTIYLVQFSLQQLVHERFAGVPGGERAAAAQQALAVLTGIYSTAYVVGTPLLGALTDRPGWRLRAIVLGAGVMGLVALTLSVLPGASVGTFYLAMVAQGTGAALFWPATQARLGDRAGREGLPAALARFNVGWTAGKALGLAGGGWLYSACGPSAALGIAAASALGTAGLSALFDRLPERPAERGPGATPAASVQARTTKRGFLVAALASNFAVWGAQATVISLVPVLGTRLGLGPRGQGLLTGGLVLAQAVTFLGLGSRGGWTYRRSFVLAVSPAAAVVALAFAGVMSLVPEGLGPDADGAPGVVALAALAASLMGMLAGASYAASIFYSLDFDERRGLRMGVNEAVLGVGALLPLLGASLGRAQAEPRLPYAVAGVACALASLVSVAALRRRDVTA